MNSDRANLIAFGLLLIAICYLATVAAVLAYNERYAEALGFGGLTTGLVGVLGTFRPRGSQPANIVENVENATVTAPEGKSE